MYSLITALGVGVYHDGYQKTAYKFDGIEKPITANLFFKAILQSKKYNIEKIIIIGTRTSAWDILAEDIENADLWAKLLELRQCPGGSKDTLGISNKMLEELQTALSEHYRLPVFLIAHTPVIENSTISTLFNDYMEAINHASETEDVILDITHGFRSMPIFMYQSLLFKFSHRPERNIKIIYGEYISEKQISEVRDLSAYWELSQITESKNLFFTQLSGKLLAEKLSGSWESCAKCIRVFSDIVENNYALQIPVILSQIENVLKKPHETPFWANDIEAFLQKFKERISAPALHETLYKYSLFLAERKLYVQAVIALQISIETKIITVISGEETDDIGDYDKWQGKDDEQSEGYRKKYLTIRKNFPARKQLIRLENLRNQIAHGGSKSRGMKGVPQAANTKAIFESAQKAVKDFFRFADEYIAVIQ